MRSAAMSTATLVTRIHLPEPGAASLRLGAIEDELLSRRIPVRVLTSTTPHGTGTTKRGLSVSRWPVLRASDGQLRGYLPYMSFDLPLALRVLFDRPSNVYLVEPPPTTGAVMRVLSTVLRRPYVFYSADVWSDAAEIAGAPRPVTSVVRWLERFALKGAAAVIAVSEGVASRARELGARNIRIIPNGVDTEIFTPNGPSVTEEEKAVAGVTCPYFVYAGTASEWQGAEIFAEALGKLSGQDVQIVFLGQGSSWETIKEHAAALPPRTDGSPAVVMLGQQPLEVAARWQAGAQGALVSIRPGLGYDFAYPTKVLSALACGVPVIYAGLGPVTNDLADLRLGRAVDYDSDEIARAMGELAELDPRIDADSRHDWVVANRSTAAVGAKVADLLEEVATA